MSLINKKTKDTVEEVKLDINETELEKNKLLNSFYKNFSNMSNVINKFICGTIFDKSKLNNSTNNEKQITLLVNSALNQKLYECLFGEFEEAYKDLSCVLRKLREFAFEINDFANDNTKEHKTKVIKEGFDLFYECFPEIYNSI